jgi:hypothetical protein
MIDLASNPGSATIMGCDSDKIILPKSQWPHVKNGVQDASIWNCSEN